MANKLYSHKFGYDLSALADYTEEQVLPLVTKALFDGKTAQVVRTQTGIKWKEVINRMDNDIYIQDGTTCGFTPSGDTIFSQRVIEVGTLKVDQSWCVQDLEKKWMQTQLTPGSLYNGIPFEGAFSEYMAGLIAEQNEVGLWQNSVSGGDLYDGFIEIIDSSGLAINGNTGSETSITKDNVIDIHDAMVAALPAALQGKKDVVFFEGWDTFIKLVQALRETNNFFYDGVKGDPYLTGELTLPGYGIRVIAVHGLDQTNRIFLGQTENFVIGTDLENDDEQFLFWLRDDKETIGFKVKWKLGTQVAFPFQIVEYTNAGG